MENIPARFILPATLSAIRATGFSFSVLTFSTSKFICGFNPAQNLSRFSSSLIPGLAMTIFQK